MDIKLIAGLLAAAIGVLTLVAGIVGLRPKAARGSSDAAPLPIAQRQSRVRLYPILMLILLVIAVLVAIGASLFGVRLEYIRPTISSPSSLISALNVPLIFIGLAACAGVVIVARFAWAALRRVRLAKNDLYFAVSLLVSVGTLLIGHFWR